MRVTATKNLREMSMAFPEDTDYEAAKVESLKVTSVMDLQSSTLLTLILQIGLGILAITYALPAFITAILLASLLGVNQFVEITTLGYMVAWALLPIVGLLQIRAGYRFYKRESGTLNSAMQIDIVAIILFGIDVIISAYQNLLIPYPEVIVYLVANIVLVILLNIRTIRDELEPMNYHPSTYQLYNG
jgi:hypothetical protein